MYRGFNYYFREGLASSAKTIYKNKCFFHYILYYLSEFFGRILIFFNPHFNLANSRQGYLIRKIGKLNFSSSFRDIGKRVRVSTYLLTLCFEALILIAGIAAFGIIAAVLGAIGYGIASIASYSDVVLFVLIFAAPAAPMLLIYLITSLLIFSPTAYIISNNEGVTAGETICACYRSMLTKGKFAVFFSYFVTLLLKSLYLGAFGAGGYFLCLFVVPANYAVIAAIGLGIVALIGYLTFAPILTLTNRVVKEHLFEDIVLDPATSVRVNEKVNLSVCKGKKIKAELTPQNLASLFDRLEDPYKILENEKKKARLIEENKPKSTAEKPHVKKERPKPHEVETPKASAPAPLVTPEKKAESTPENIVIN